MTFGLTYRVIIGANECPHRMSAISKIVSGGGWKDTRSERVKVKAWAALFMAIALGSLSLTASDLVWMMFAAVPAGFSVLTCIVLFTRERPREFHFPWGRAGHDPRNLYGAFGSTAHRTGGTNAKPGAPSNAELAALLSNSGITEGLPSRELIAGHRHS